MRETLVRAQLGVSEWVQGLAGIPATEFTQENVQRYIAQNGIAGSSPEPYIYFSAERYTRNGGLLGHWAVEPDPSAQRQVGMDLSGRGTAAGPELSGEGGRFRSRHLPAGATVAAELSTENAGHIDRVAGGPQGL
jgi:hypothetical protein